MKISLREKPVSIFLNIIFFISLLFSLSIYPLFLVVPGAINHIFFLFGTFVFINILSLVIIKQINSQKLSSEILLIEISNEQVIHHLIVFIVSLIPILFVWNYLDDPIETGGGDEVHFAMKLFYTFSIFTLNGALSIQIYQILFLLFLSIIIAIVYIQIKKPKTFNLIKSKIPKGKLFYICLFLIIEAFYLIAIIIFEIKFNNFSNDTVYTTFIRYGPISGLFHLIPSLLLGVSEFSLRFFTIICYIILIQTSFSIVSRSRGYIPGYSAIVLIISSKIFLMWTPSAYIDIPLLTIMSFLCWFFLRFIDEYHRFDIALATWILFSLGYLFKRPIILLLFILPIVLVIKDKREVISKNIAFFKLSWIPIPIIIGMTLLQSFNDIRSYSIYLTNLSSHLFDYLFYIDFCLSPLFLIVVVCIIPLFLLSIFNINLIRLDPIIWTLLGLFGGFYLFFTLDDPYWLPHPRFALIVFYPICLLIPCIMDDVIQFLSNINLNKYFFLKTKFIINKKYSIALIMIVLTSILSISAILNNNPITIYDSKEKMDYENLFEFINNEIPKEANLIHDKWTPLPYYGLIYDSPHNFIRNDYSELVNLTESELIIEFRNICTENDALYIILIDNGRETPINWESSILNSSDFSIIYHPNENSLNFAITMYLPD